ncbi:MAG: ROK family protein, partial [Beijerinckiaceae bacterium]
GLWVGLDRIALQATDFTGRTIASRDERVALSRLPAEAFFDTLAARVQNFRDQIGAGAALGLGVAFQGFVDQTAGSVVWSPVTAQGDLAVVDALSARLGLPVELDNDASAMAFAIMRGERALQTGVTACVMLGDGVGLGVFIDGQPLRGARGGGMEFGHVRLGGGGPQCRCGARGCIESYLADYALYRDAMAVADLPPPEVGRQPSEAEMAALVARGTAGDKAILDLFSDVGRVLADGATMLIHLFQPTALVFCGPGARAWYLLEDALRRGVAESAIPRLGGATRIDAIPFRPELLTEGVVLRALDSQDRRLAAGL